MFVPYFLFSNVKFNVTVRPFEYHNFLAPRIKGMPTSTHHTHAPITHKEARDQISLALIHLIPLVDYNIKVLSINQKLIKIWKKKHYSN